VAIAASVLALVALGLRVYSLSGKYKGREELIFLKGTFSESRESAPNQNRERRW